MEHFYIDYLQACLPVLKVLRSKLHLEDRLKIDSYEEVILIVISEDSPVQYSLINIFIAVRTFINRDFDFMNEDKEVA